MNFTPRAVSMGNKVYKLHVKCEGGKDTLSVHPDYSVGQLKSLIGAKFHISPSQLLLTCNGKPLQGEDHATLKQARVYSGSKILAMKAGKSETGDVNNPYSQDKNVKIKPADERDGENTRDKELLARLTEVERQASGLEALVTRLGNQSEGDIHKRKKESRMAGEELMRLLEALDNISLETSMEDLRARRKKIARNLNTILDINDSNIQGITDSLQNENGCAK